MKMTLLSVIVALAVMAGAYGVAGAASAPHTDYTPEYGGGCGNTAACHNIAKGAFLPSSLDERVPPNYPDWTNFCLTCHNVSGEAHDRSAGSPSTNVYVNRTGFNQDGGYKGVSHSWRGTNHNAGTRTPVSSGFVSAPPDFTGYSGTSFMPLAGKVTCQTCHQGMNKISGIDNLDWVQATDSSHSYDHIHYNILGYTSTKQYLAQYIRVFRSGVPLDRTTGVPNSRTKKNYLVSPSEYAYKNQSALVTFNTSQGSNYIYVDISNPYLRVDDTANAVCLDCHADRAINASQASHEPGTGAKNQHPVVVNYGHTNGLNDTLKASANSNIYLEVVGGQAQVLCTSCHKTHNAPSNNGQLTRNKDASALCADCHKTKLDGYSSAGSVNNHSSSRHTTVCLDCHTTHNSNNILLIRDVVNGNPVNFQVFSGVNSFGSGSGSGLCEVCHSGLGHHNAGVVDTSGHHNNDRCTKCHKHETGFTGGGCTSCHGYPPPPAPSGWASSAGDLHVSHMAHLGAAPFNLSGTAACAQCHGPQIPTATHNQNKSSAFMNTTTWSWTNQYNGHNYGKASFSDGGTVGKTNTLDDTCTNVNCHSAASTRTWHTPAGCNGCHAFPPMTNGHLVQYASGIRSHLVSAGDPIYSAITAYGQAGWPCGKCHNNTKDKHGNGVVDVNAGGGYGACGGDFTINQTVSGSNVTCSNAVCHTANKTTPNWY